MPGGKLRRRTWAAQSGTREMAQSFWRKHTQLGSGGVRTGSTWTKSSARAGTQGSENEIWLSAYFCTFWNTATLITYGLWPPLCSRRRESQPHSVIEPNMFTICPLTEDVCRLCPNHTGGTGSRPLSFCFFLLSEPVCRLSQSNSH